MIISFAWTTPALLAGAKTMTRRDWKPEHAACFHAGDLVDAWNRSPRVGRGAGARKVATIRITHEPYQQMSDALHQRDVFDEGFPWLAEHGEAETVAAIVSDWTYQPQMLWVVRFELVGVESAAERARPERGPSASTFPAEDRPRGRDAART